MADTEHTHQPPPTAEEDTPPPPSPPSVEPPLASVEVESVAEAEEHHSAVTVVEKEGPLTQPPPEPTLVAAEQVSVTVPEKEAEGVTESEKSKPVEVKKIPESLVSFKEESNKVSDLSDSEGKVLEELKFLVQEAIKIMSFTTGTPAKTQEAPSASSESKTPATEITDLPQEK
ncbi:hypothetical protein HAX54_047963 [Datura stramonium]|uniref:Uncharacterized protein n=1 Tax=Datura stramonium TaxID=4076 RepID=A0ABS8WL67_DATST|nr:hypothetical protein [Datura stramonium]